MTESEVTVVHDVSGVLNPLLHARLQAPAIGFKQWIHYVVAMIFGQWICTLLKNVACPTLLKNVACPFCF